MVSAATEVDVLIEVVLLSGLVALQALVLFALYEVVRQQGRILLRLEALENITTAAPTREVGAANGRRTAQNEQLNPRGLARGAKFPAFRLQSVAGNEMRLADFRGRRVLLVHWSQSCGFCTMISSDLAALRPVLKKHGVELVLASHGEADGHRHLASELGCDILLQEDGRTVEAFRSFGTPAGYLIDEEGRVASSLALGGEAVTYLAREILGSKRLPSERSLSSSKLVRDGLEVGADAPNFELPDLQGRLVTLREYAGRRVLLVFTDPECGPCDALLSELVRVEREWRQEFAFVLVGRGDAQANREKARKHGVTFPYVVQDGWQLSKQYGIFATPVAFLIDESGSVARRVCKGADAILALVDEKVYTA